MTLGPGTKNIAMPKKNILRFEKSNVSLDIWFPIQGAQKIGPSFKYPREMWPFFFFFFFLILSQQNTSSN